MRPHIIYSCAVRLAKLFRVADVNGLMNSKIKERLQASICAQTKHMPLVQRYDMLAVT
jgi:hypothetical protein